MLHIEYIKEYQLGELRNERYKLAQLFKQQQENPNLAFMTKAQVKLLQAISYEVDYRDALKYAIDAPEMNEADAKEYANALYPKRNA